MKSMYESYRRMAKAHPQKESVEPYTHRPVYNGINPTTYERTFEDLSKTHYFNTNRFIEPYSSRYFGSSIMAVQACEDLSLVPVNDLRIDPNKIFSADIQAMKSLAADQYKLKKVFEKKFMEVMNDKNKYGLTEDDIAAMQALTAANTSIGNYTKEIVNFKKVATELKIKAQQATMEKNGGPNVGGSMSRPIDNASTAKTLMDNIFGAATSLPDEIDYDAPDVDPVALGSILPETNDNTKFESRGIQTYAVVGESGKPEDCKFVAIDKDNNIMGDVDLPNIADIKSIDPVTKTVTMNNEMEYKSMPSHITPTISV